MGGSRPADHHAPGVGPDATGRWVRVIGGLVLSVLVLTGAVLMGLVVRNTLSGDSAAPTVVPGGFAYAEIRTAPPLELTDQDGNPFALSALAGHPVLVYFGYTHCPDVCPTSIGIINQVLAEAGPDTRAVFASIDPDRDDAAAMKSYLRYLPEAYVGLSGTPDAVRRTADAWGVKYAKIETGSAGGYAMGHTSDVYLVDGLGQLRAVFPFGTKAAPITTAVQELLTTMPVPGGTPVPIASGGASASAPAPASTPAQAPGALALYPELVSTSIWTGGQSPVILTVRDATGAALDERAGLRVRLASIDGAPSGPDVEAVSVRSERDTKAWFVANVDIPSTGRWRLDLADAAGAVGSLEITAMDPGSTPRLGDRAPSIATPTLADVGGDPRSITTVRDPDLRLSNTSTAQATADGKTYVLLIDSARFETTPACGRALSIVRYLVDRWPGVTFIHLEPYEYSIVNDEPVLNGKLTAPPVTRYARAWGMGEPPWPPTAQPWMYVVDGSGIVRARYTGIMGSDDIEAILAMLGEARSDG